MFVNRLAKHMWALLTKVLILLRRAEWAYAFVAILFGIIFCAVTPPFQVPDEGAHLCRAYQIAYLEITPEKTQEGTGGSLPKALVEFVRAFEPMSGYPDVKITDVRRVYEEASLAFRRDPGAVKFVPFSNTAVYPPLPYIPQAACLRISFLFTDSLIIAMWLGRIGNLISAVAITGFSIRLMPGYRWLLCALALSPMTVFLSASLSSDAMTNAISFLVFSTTCRLMAPYAISNRFFSFFCIAIASALCVVKQGYFLLSGAYAGAPSPSGGWSRAKFLALVFGTQVLTLGGWAIVVSGTYSPVIERVNPKAQLLHLIEHPQKLFEVLRNTYFDPQYSFEWARQYYGVLGTLDTLLSDWSAVLHFSLIAWLAVHVTDATWRPTARQRSALLVTAALTTFFLTFAIYVTWMGVGDSLVQIQGRYLTPIVPFFVMATSGFFLPCKNAVEKQHVLASCAIRVQPLIAILVLSLNLSLAVQACSLRFYNIQ